MRRSSESVTFRLLNRLNRLVCRVMYKVTPPSTIPLPEAGPVLLVSDHTTLTDPMVLLATAGRPIAFLMTRDIYQRPHLRWVFKAFNCIPVRRGSYDVGAVRTMLRVLGHGEVVGIFPEGGISEYRQESGHRGIGYLALKTGVPVVPVSIVWDRVRPLHLLGSLLIPGRAIVRYGKPIIVRPDPAPAREKICEVTAGIMRAIQDLRKLSG